MKKTKQTLTPPLELANIPFSSQPQAVSNFENAVFVSYAWDAESEHVLDELEQAFAKHNLQIIRDRKDIPYKGSIKAFEQRIGQGQCVILVISDKYLRSEHCMYELVEVDKNRESRERIFPIVLSDAHIFKALDRLAYIHYWDEQVDKLNQEIKKVKVITNVTGFTDELNNLNRIRTNFDHITDLLGDMNALTPELHAASGFSTLISSIELALKKKQTATRSSTHQSLSHGIANQKIAPALPKITNSPVKRTPFKLRRRRENESENGAKPSVSVPTSGIETRLGWNIDPVGFPMIFIEPVDLWMQVFPMTKQQYGKYTENMPSNDPGATNSPRQRKELVHHFVTGITFKDAEEYAHLIGEAYLLPDVATWRKTYAWLSKQPACPLPGRMQELSKVAIRLWNLVWQKNSPKTLLDQTLMAEGVLEWAINMESVPQRTGGMGKPFPGLWQVLRSPLDNPVYPKSDLTAFGFRLFRRKE